MNIYIYIYIYPPAPLWGTTAVRAIADILSLCPYVTMAVFSLCPVVSSQCTVVTVQCQLSAISVQCIVYSTPPLMVPRQHRNERNSITKKDDFPYLGAQILQNTIRERLAAQIHCKYKCLSVRSPPRMHHPDIGPSTFDYKTPAKRPSSVRSPSQCHRSIFAYLIKIMHFTQLSKPYIKPTK